MSAFRSDLDLEVYDVTGNGVQVDVATNANDGTVRLAVLFTQEIHLSADSAERVARSLLAAAAHARRFEPKTGQEP
ncbi:hypothetical protein ACFVAQ_28275 [Streptomyces sp. NPDC057651]|uniref:hypothetical protein n=1 Tax=unclassified Streptomyces TaxID=2593676 RepID=UPI00367BFC3C